MNSFQDSYLINLFKVMISGDLCEKIVITKRHELGRINTICENLFVEDYYLHLINNSGGVLCPHYPPSILIPYQKEEADKREDCVSKMSDNNIYMQYIQKSINARCRSRFPVPVLRFNNKFLCRSSTLSGTFEIYGKRYFSQVFGSNSVTNSNDDIATGTEHFDNIRGEDIYLLKYLKIKYIFDLMLENKKLMFGFPVSSSEKCDRHNRYKDFTIISLPYPGCEFFCDWAKNHYPMEGVFFEWDKVEINSKLRVPIDFQLTMSSHLNWDDYQSWSLTELTTNYLKLMLGILIEEQQSVLVHCISGWDRTPLFISLLRCLLWADGLIHQSLDPKRMLYLTLAYDWFLFGHQTKTRIQLGEEILYFCFRYLKYASCDESLSTIVVYSTQASLERRKEKLEELFEIFQKFYSQEISGIVGKSTKKHGKTIISSASNLLNGIFGSFSTSESYNQ